MGFLTTNSFCCCLPLKLGGLVLGLLSIGFCIAGSIKITVEHIKYSTHHERHPSGYYAEFAAKTALYQFQLLFAIFWLYGIFAKKTGWMLAYLGYNLVIFGALLSFYVVFFASFFVDFSLSRYMGINDSHWSWVILIMLLPATVIAWHCTSVMYSLYQKIRKEHRLHPSVLYEATTAKEDKVTIKA